MEQNNETVATRHEEKAPFDIATWQAELAIEDELEAAVEEALVEDVPTSDILTPKSPPLLYETYIAKSRYARYLDAASRRENWGETVQRYFDFMTQHLEAKHSYTIPPELLKELQTAVENFEVMPSMRALMT